ncbi:hypothetical protein Btru_016412 [Bulinus truncatus]|nr:hypothetical protein Btru_016412 [Bulinus truncatus]
MRKCRSYSPKRRSCTPRRHRCCCSGRRSESSPPCAVCCDTRKRARSESPTRKCPKVCLPCDPCDPCYKEKCSKRRCESYYIKKYSGRCSPCGTRPIDTLLAKYDYCCPQRCRESCSPAKDPCFSSKTDTCWKYDPCPTSRYDPCCTKVSDPCFSSKYDSCLKSSFDFRCPKNCNPCSMNRFNSCCPKPCDPCFTSKHEPCYPKKYDTYMPSICDPCYPPKYEPCFISKYDPCPSLKYDSCSPKSYDPCFQSKYDPCFQSKHDPCFQSKHDDPCCTKKYQHGSRLDPGCSGRCEVCCISRGLPNIFQKYDVECRDVCNPKAWESGYSKVNETPCIKKVAIVCQPKQKENETIYLTKRDPSILDTGSKVNFGDHTMTFDTFNKVVYPSEIPIKQDSLRRVGSHSELPVHEESSRRVVTSDECEVSKAPPCAESESKPRDPCRDMCNRDLCKDKCRKPCKEPCNREPCRDQCRDQCRDPCRDQCRDQSRDQCRDPCRDQCRDQSRDQCRDPCRDQCRDPCRDQSRDQCRDPCRDQSRDQCRDKCRDPCRDQCKDTCNLTEPSAEFLEKFHKLGKLPRDEQHMCPWEADVTVNGNVRAHCDSTAVEIAKKMTGRYRAQGERMTTDSCAQIPIECEDEDDQCLNLGQLDDGTCLDFSRNNKLIREKSRNEHLCTWKLIKERQMTSNKSTFNRLASNGKSPDFGQNLPQRSKPFLRFRETGGRPESSSSNVKDARKHSDRYFEASVGHDGTLTQRCVTFVSGRRNNYNNSKNSTSLSARHNGSHAHKSPSGSAEIRSDSLHEPKRGSPLRAPRDGSVAVSVSYRTASEMRDDLSPQKLPASGRLTTSSQLSREVKEFIQDRKSLWHHRSSQRRLSRAPCEVHSEETWRHHQHQSSSMPRRLSMASFSTEHDHFSSSPHKRNLIAHRYRGSDDE